MTQIRRPHYFKGQFLKADDFIAEQEYHMQARRLHNSSLHTWGIVGGLDVTADDAGVKVSAGSAIDKDGKETWLPEDRSLPIAQSTADGSYFVVIAYKEGYDPESPYPSAGESDPEDSRYIRKVETGELSLVAAVPAPANEAGLLKLALVSVTGGKVTGQPDNSVSRTASSARANGGDLEIRPVASNGSLRLMTGAPLTARLTIDAKGNVGIGNDLSVMGALSGARLSTSHIKLRGDDGNHGISYFGEGAAKEVGDFALDGPVLYGYHGGALGCSNGEDKKNKTVALRWNDQGRVGIGTTDPQATLQVGKAGSEGAPSLRIGWGEGNNEDRLTIYNSDNFKMGLRRGTRDLKIFAKSSDGDGHIYLMPNDTVAMSLMSNGNVGIGTTNPQAPLVVSNKAAKVSMLKLLNPNGAAGDQWWLGFDHGADSTDDNDRARVGVDILGGGAGRLFFTTGLAKQQQERMRIDESGNVGIGTTDVQSRLMVRGGEKLVPIGDFWTFGSASKGVVNPVASSTRVAGVAPGDLVEMGGQRRVVSAVSAADNTLTVNPAFAFPSMSSGTPLYAVKPGQPILRADDYNGNPVFSVSGDGDVGIGTTSPGAHLDVSGRILRNGKDFSSAGQVHHEGIVSVPWGTSADWNIFVAPRWMGREESGSEGDNALLVINCYAEPRSDDTSWKVNANFKYRWANKDGSWIDGDANYLLVPK